MWQLAMLICSTAIALRILQVVFIWLDRKLWKSHQMYRVGLILANRTNDPPRKRQIIRAIPRDVGIDNELPKA